MDDNISTNSIQSHLRLIPGTLKCHFFLKKKGETSLSYCKICIRSYPENSKFFRVVYNVDPNIAVHFLSNHVG